jgi:hypothetical protein
MKKDRKLMGQFFDDRAHLVDKLRAGKRGFTPRKRDGVQKSRLNAKLAAPFGRNPQCRA